MIAPTRSSAISIPARAFFAAVSSRAGEEDAAGGAASSFEGVGYACAGGGAAPSARAETRRPVGTRARPWRGEEARARSVRRGTRGRPRGRGEGGGGGGRRTARDEARREVPLAAAGAGFAPPNRKHRGAENRRRAETRLARGAGLVRGPSARPRWPEGKNEEGRKRELPFILSSLGATLCSSATVRVRACRCQPLVFSTGGGRAIDRVVRRFPGSNALEAIDSTRVLRGEIAFDRSPGRSL